MEEIENVTSLGPKPANNSTMSACTLYLNQAEDGMHSCHSSSRRLPAELSCGSWASRLVNGRAHLLLRSCKAMCGARPTALLCAIAASVLCSRSCHHSALPAVTTTPDMPAKSSCCKKWWEPRQLGLYTRWEQKLSHQLRDAARKMCSVVCIQS